MSFNENERIRCEILLEKIRQTKFLCLQSIESLLDQQKQIDECLDDLRKTRRNAEQINENIFQISKSNFIEKIFLFFGKKSILKETNFDENQLLIFPFPKLNELPRDVQFENLIQSFDEPIQFYDTFNKFETILHEEYVKLFQLAKKLTETIKIFHDTIEFLGNDIRSTLEHVENAQQHFHRLLKVKAPLGFAQIFF